MKVFISHASEDKRSVARPLAQKLREGGCEVWLDEFVLKLGDSLRREIERGLRECDFGVVVLSRCFFEKEWPQRELDSLTAREVSERRKLVLPVWHDVDTAFISQFSPNLADKLGVSTSIGIDQVSLSVLQVVNHYRSVLENTQQNALIENSEWLDDAERLYIWSLARAVEDEENDCAEAE